MNRANQIELVRNLGVHRKQLAHLDARHVRLDRRKETAVVARRIGLQVVGFHMRWPAIGWLWGGLNLNRLRREDRRVLV